MAPPRVLILGAAGMLGHKLWQTLRARADTWCSVRQSFDRYADYGLFDQSRTVTGVEGTDFATIARAVEAVLPTVVVNCIGIVKQRSAAHDPIASILVNALLPHRLAELSAKASARMIQVSTDCVFSGNRGTYTETDNPDPPDLY